MLGKDRLPNRQQDWPIPPAPPNIDHGWAWRQVDKLGKDTLPFRQQDWPNPLPPSLVDANWTRGFEPLRSGPIQAPLDQNAYYDRPTYPPFIDQTWVWRQVGMLGQDKLPFRQQDWPNPTPTISVQTWTWRQTGMLGRDVLPFRQQDWPNPVPPPNIDHGWLLPLNLALKTFVAPPLPFNQYYWPNPVPPPRPIIQNLTRSLFDTSAVVPPPLPTSPDGFLRWNLERAGWPKRRRKPTLLEILADIIEEDPPPVVAPTNRRQKARAQAQRWAEEIVDRAQREARSYELDFAKATIDAALKEHAISLISSAHQRRLDQEEEEAKAILFLLSYYY